jgi:hypothetical protein
VENFQQVLTAMTIEGPRAELQYRKEFKNGGLATMFRLK